VFFSLPKWAAAYIVQNLLMMPREVLREDNHVICLEKKERVMQRLPYIDYKFVIVQ
jgi:hypothetical protein